MELQKGGGGGGGPRTLMGIHGSKECSVFYSLRKQTKRVSVELQKGEINGN